MTTCHRHHKSFFFRIISLFVLTIFTANTVLPPAYAQALSSLSGVQGVNLPVPGTMVALSPSFSPPMIQGINVHPEDPLKFDFIIDHGDARLSKSEFADESQRLIKYFLAALTTPEDEMWVNLSPYEKNRIIPDSFGTTEMGRDLLAQDYLLKQLTASLMYPEEALGERFWKHIHQKAQEQFGTTDIPMNTFNKVWIVPESATVYEHNKGAFVVESHLKVMLESDYVALQRAQEHNLPDGEAGSTGVQENNDVVVGEGFQPSLGNLNNQSETIDRSSRTGLEPVPTDNNFQSELIREIIIPAIEKEVNEGETFANLRQIYNAVILATWYKKALKGSLLGKVYVDQGKTRGVAIDDPRANQKIYDQYLEAFKTGVYNYIKEDYDPATQEVIPRQYFSGGANLKETDEAMVTIKDGDAFPKDAAASAARHAAESSDIVQAQLNPVGLPEDLLSGEGVNDQAMVAYGLKIGQEVVTPQGIGKVKNFVPGVKLGEGEETGPGVVVEFPKKSDVTYYINIETTIIPLESLSGDIQVDPRKFGYPTQLENQLALLLVRAQRQAFKRQTGIKVRLFYFDEYNYETSSDFQFDLSDDVSYMMKIVVKEMREVVGDVDIDDYFGGDTIDRNPYMWAQNFSLDSSRVDQYSEIHIFEKTPVFEKTLGYENRSFSEMLDDIDRSFFMVKSNITVQQIQQLETHFIRNPVPSKVLMFLDSFADDNELSRTEDIRDNEFDSMSDAQRYWYLLSGFPELNDADAEQIPKAEAAKKAFLYIWSSLNKSNKEKFNNYYGEILEYYKQQLDKQSDDKRTAQVVKRMSDTLSMLQALSDQGGSQGNDNSILRPDDSVSPESSFLIKGDKSDEPDDQAMVAFEKMGKYTLKDIFNSFSLDWMEGYVINEIVRYALKRGYSVDEERLKGSAFMLGLRELVLNLAQHGYPVGGGDDLMFRIFESKDPVEGIRIEFWQPGMKGHGLPERLKSKQWFTSRDRPWRSERAPDDAIVKNFGGGHTGISRAFDNFFQVEQEWEGRIHVGWRNVKGNEGGQTSGQITAIQIPMQRVETSQSPLSQQKDLKEANAEPKKRGIDLNLNTTNFSGKRGDGKDDYAMISNPGDTGLNPSESKYAEIRNIKKVDGLVDFLHEKYQEGILEKEWGINFSNYQQYGQGAIYYLIRDIKEKIGFEGRLSARVLPDKINTILPKKLHFKREDLSFREFFILKEWLEELYINESFSEYSPFPRFIKGYKRRIQSEKTEINSEGDVSLQALIKLINSRKKIAELLGVSEDAPLLGQWYMPSINLSMEQFEVIENYFKGMNKEKLDVYGTEDGSGVAKLVREISESKEGDVLYPLKGVHLGHLTGLLNSRKNMAGLLEISENDPLLNQWHMPYIYLAMKQFYAIENYFKGMDQKKLNVYGREDGFGVIKLVKEINNSEKSDVLYALRGINLASLTGLLNSRKRMAGLMGIAENDPLLSQWNMPKINLSMKQIEAVEIYFKEMNKEKLDIYGAEDGSGLIKFIKEIQVSRKGEVLYVLKEINLGYLTGLLSSRKKMSGLLGIAENDPLLNQWNMPKIDLTMKQFYAIENYFKGMDQKKLNVYGREDGFGVIKLVKEINNSEKSDVLYALRGINLASLTGLLNSRKKMAGLLGIAENDPLLSQWNMPFVGLSMKQFEAIRVYFKKMGKEEMDVYGAEDGSGLIKFIKEIQVSRKGEVLYVLKEINLGYLTGLLSSRKKMSGLLGIAENDPLLNQWNMPKIDLTMKQFEAVRGYFKKMSKEEMDVYGAEDGSGVIKLAREISESKQGELLYSLRWVHLGHLTGLLNSRKKMAGMLGISADDPLLSQWRMPFVGLSMKQFEAIRVYFKKMGKEEMDVYGAEDGSGVVKLLQEIMSSKQGEVLYSLRSSHLGSLTGLLNSRKKMAGVLGISENDALLSHWNMPYISMTMEQFEAIKGYFKGMDKEKLNIYGAEDGSGIVKLVADIQASKRGERLYFLKDIHLAFLTGLLNSRKKMAGLLGIAENDPLLNQWNMLYINLTMDQFRAVEDYFKEIDKEQLDVYGAKDGSGVAKLVREIRESKKGDVLYPLKGVHLGHLTGLLNSRKRMAGLMGITENDPLLSQWNMPFINYTMEKFLRTKFLHNKEDINDDSLKGGNSNTIDLPEKGKDGESDQAMVADREIPLQGVGSIALNNSNYQGYQRWLEDKDNGYIDIQTIPSAAIVDVGSGFDEPIIDLAEYFYEKNPQLKIYGVEPRKDPAVQEIFPGLKKAPSNLTFLEDDHRLMKYQKLQEPVKIISSFNVLHLYQSEEDRRAIIQQMGSRLENQGLLIIGSGGYNADTGNDSSRFIVFQKDKKQLIPKEIVLSQLFFMEGLLRNTVLLEKLNDESRLKIGALKSELEAAGYDFNALSQNAIFLTTEQQVGILEKTGFPYRLTSTGLLTVPLEPLLASGTKGGIDLNPNAIDMTVDKEGGRGFAFPAPTPEQIQQFQQVDGFVPVILNMTPATNLPLLIGLEKNPENQHRNAAADSRRGKPAAPYISKKRFELEAYDRLSLVKR